MIARPRPRCVRAQVRPAVLVEQAAEDGVGRAEVGEGGCLAARRGATRSGGAQGWPSTAPGTPVFVEYFGWIFISGRSRCTAWATAIAASA